MSDKKSALILGATGAVGKHLLRDLLASPHFDRVGEFGRRVTEKEKLEGTDISKLVQKKIDFEKLAESDQGLKEGKWDVVFITLGTTRKAAGSAANFEKIDREYVVNAARAARTDGLKQKVVYCSSTGANPSSSFLYVRSKGLTETGLASLGYSETIIFRPAYLANGDRGNRNILEDMIAPISKALACLSNSVEIDVGVLGKAMAIAGRLGSEALPKEARASKAGPADAPFTVVGNAGALHLGKST